jgi:hypothetical protein
MSPIAISLSGIMQWLGGKPAGECFEENEPGAKRRAGRTSNKPGGSLIARRITANGESVARPRLFSMLGEKSRRYIMVRTSP